MNVLKLRERISSAIVILKVGVACRYRLFSLGSASCTLARCLVPRSQSFVAVSGGVVDDLQVRDTSPLTPGSLLQKAFISLPGKSLDRGDVASHAPRRDLSVEELRGGALSDEAGGQWSDHLLRIRS